MDGKYVFISYSSKDKEQAEWVKNTLEYNGIQCWMAPYSIPLGSSYATEIENAIKNCTAFVLVLSERAQSSKWVSKEVDRAINFNKRVLPFALDNAPLEDDFSFYLSNVQRYDATTDKLTLTAIQTMIEAIREEFNAPAEKIKIQKKLPKSKNNGKKKKTKLWKILIIAFLVLSLLLGALDFLGDKLNSYTEGSEAQSDIKSDLVNDTTKNNLQGLLNNNEEETSDSVEGILNDLTFELDGVTYSLPCNFSDLLENGWTCPKDLDGYLTYGDYIKLEKSDSSIWVKTYSIYENESSTLREHKVGTIEYTPDCNVSFSVNGTIKPGTHQNDVSRALGEPESNSSWMDNTEYCYLVDDDNDNTELSFVFYTDTSRCHSITLKNEVYSKKY